MRYTINGKYYYTQSHVLFPNKTDELQRDYKLLFRKPHPVKPPIWTKKRKTIALATAFVAAVVVFGVLAFFAIAFAICIALAFRQ